MLLRCLELVVPVCATCSMCKQHTCDTVLPYSHKRVGQGCWFEVLGQELPRNGELYAYKRPSSRARATASVRR